jgi:hypothetical protein
MMGALQGAWLQAAALLAAHPALAIALAIALYLGACALLICMFGLASDPQTRLEEDREQAIAITCPAPLIAPPAVRRRAGGRP